MAKMYPEKAPELLTREDRRRKLAEKRIYDILHDHLPQSYTVFWGVSWLAKRRTDEAHDGEADFIVIHPEHGILIIEVKGGSIRHDGATGTWTSIDSDGRSHTIVNPFSQVKRNYYALKSKLNDSSLTSRYTYPMARAVWFPALSKGSTNFGLDAPLEIVLDRNVE